MPTLQTIAVTSVDPENPTELVALGARHQVVVKALAEVTLVGDGLSPTFLHAGEYWLSPHEWYAALGAYTANNGTAEANVLVWVRESADDAAVPLEWMAAA